MALPGKSRFVMDAKPAPRAGVTLFCARDDLPSLWARIVLAEKDVDNARLELLQRNQMHPDLLVLNPSGILPTLADRDTVLYPARVVVEYLDERYPHPKLMPADPAARARLRMLLSHIEQDLFASAALIRSAPKSPEAKDARKALSDGLLASRRLFGTRGWCLGLEFNLADCAFAALLASLASLGIKPPADAGLQAYAQRVLTRGPVQSALR